MYHKLYEDTASPDIPPVRAGREPNCIVLFGWPSDQMLIVMQGPGGNVSFQGNLVTGEQCCSRGLGLLRSGRCVTFEIIPARQARGNGMGRHMKRQNTWAVI